MLNQNCLNLLSSSSVLAGFVFCWGFKASMKTWATSGVSHLLSPPLGALCDAFGYWVVLSHGCWESRLHFASTEVQPPLRVHWKPCPGRASGGGCSTRCRRAECHHCWEMHRFRSIRTEFPQVGCMLSKQKCYKRWLLFVGLAGL